MKFISENLTGTKVTVEISDDSTIDQALDAFMDFLRAAGYVIDYNKTLVLEDYDDCHNSKIFS